jgi:hypothetical protein
MSVPLLGRGAQILSGLGSCTWSCPASRHWHLVQLLVNRLDTALNITVLHHGFYVGAISIWGGLARPNGRASKHDQMFIELNSLDLDVSTSSEVEAGETADHA